MVSEPILIVFSWCQTNHYFIDLDSIKRSYWKVKLTSSDLFKSTYHWTIFDMETISKPNYDKQAYMSISGDVKEIPNIVTPRPTKLWKGNVFSRVCLSVSYSVHRIPLSVQYQPSLNTRYFQASSTWTSMYNFDLDHLIPKFSLWAH